MDPITITFLVISVVSGVAGIVRQSNANDAADAENNRKLAAAEAVSEAERLNNDATYIATIRQAEADTAAANATAIMAQQRQKNILIYTALAALLTTCFLLIARYRP